MLELPANLVFDGFRSAGFGEPGGPGGIGGSTQCVRSHMAHGYALTGGSSSGHRRGSTYMTRNDAPDKPAANLVSGVQFSSGERPCPGNEGPRPPITWGVSLEESQNPLGAVGGPCGHKAPVRLAERLGRSHHLAAFVPDQVASDGLAGCHW